MNMSRVLCFIQTINNQFNRHETPEHKPAPLLTLLLFCYSKLADVYKNNPMDSTRRSGAVLYMSHTMRRYTTGGLTLSDAKESL